MCGSRPEAEAVTRSTGTGAVLPGSASRSAWIIGVPRVVLSAFYDRPLGIEGTLSILCVVLGLLVLIGRARN